MKELTFLLGLLVILTILSIKPLLSENFVANATLWPFDRVLQPINYALSFPWLNYYPVRYDYYGLPYAARLPGPWNQLTH